MTSPTAKPVRRTQRERKEETVGRLVGAAVDAITEVGYARTSIGEICARSGVSKGGLFRHFDSRLDLMVAAAEEVAERHLAAVRPHLSADADLLSTLALMRDRNRAADNVVWFELMVAARTDEALRARLAPAAERFFTAITALAAEVPAVAALPEASRHLVVSTLRQLFDGEAISRVLVPEPAVEARRLELAARFAEFLAAHPQG